MRESLFKPKFHIHEPLEDSPILISNFCFIDHRCNHSYFFSPPLMQSRAQTTGISKIYISKSCIQNYGMVSEKKTMCSIFSMEFKLLKYWLSIQIQSLAILAIHVCFHLAIFVCLFQQPTPLNRKIFRIYGWFLHLKNEEIFLKRKIKPISVLVA